MIYIKIIVTDNLCSMFYKDYVKISKDGVINLTILNIILNWSAEYTFQPLKI